MEPLPQSLIGQRFCETFSYRWMCIEGSTENAAKTDWRTITKYPLKPRVFWAKHQDAGQQVGVRFDKDTRYAVIDIDAGSAILNQIPLLRAALETIGIVRTVPLRSSWSGGLHLYIPLPAPVSTFGLACALRQCLESQGFEIKDGQLEIFPNIKAFGAFWEGKFTEYKAHRLPLQPGSGSCLLTEDLQPIGGDLERFFYAWDVAALCQDMDELHQALSIARDNRRRRPRRRAVGPVEEWKNELELEISEGWTGHGQTNSLLKSIACYGHVFERLEGASLREYTERIATSRPGFERWCQHHHDITMRCKVWAAAVQKYYWPLGTEPKRDRSLGRFMSAINRRRQEDACDRISAAYEQLRAVGLPEQIRELAKRLTQHAKCSMATLYKHLDLWHPEHSVCNTPPTPTTSATDSPSDRPIPSPIQTAETLANQGVTPRGGKYEGCSAETSHLKNLSPGGRGRGRGEGEGFSTGAAPT
ncbi:hypothetical protein [Pseudanabaena sp. FACHB-2040]|uniref:hypothetical protein n=1 Tax=Pseudanabaena sp. FACHB-2040 TaxID=2692859 RepID=UPI001683080E|nr:hypothetical protein [Pseudanabaena sp. FACHB-2040]MBD2259898.1 hypothetical protein [Pseudanabaena sp. FACHB-2040]